jgi:hypothetical protein
MHVKCNRSSQGDNNLVGESSVGGRDGHAAQRQELGAMMHGAELGHVGAASAHQRQQSTHLGAKICGAERCYLGATAYDAE